MRMINDFDLVFDKEKYLAAREDKFGHLVEKSGLRRKFDDAFDDARKYCQPIACYKAFPIGRIRHQKVDLDAGVTLGGGPVVSVIAGAREVVLAVCTLGRAIDERIKELRNDNHAFKMLMLDELASWGLDQVRYQVLAEISRGYASLGWRTSSCLSPGESSWSVHDQKIIFQMLDTKQIGVELSSEYVMIPLKSLSLLVGVGDRPLGIEGLSSCEFCSIKNRCQYSGLRVS